MSGAKSVPAFANRYSTPRAARSSRYASAVVSTLARFVIGSLPVRRSSRGVLGRLQARAGALEEHDGEAERQADDVGQEPPGARGRRQQQEPGRAEAEPRRPAHPPEEGA